MTLYEIDNAIAEVLNNADMETGEIDANALDALEMERQQKCENIALAFKNVLADAVALENEEKAFKERKEKAMNKAKSLKKYLVYALNGESLDTGKVQVKCRTTYAVSDITENQVFDLPKKFTKVKTSEVADKVAIRKALLGDDEELKKSITKCGVHLVEHRSVSVK